MPKAIVDAAKGLYQTAGAGLFINSGAPLVLSHDTLTLDSTSGVVNQAASLDTIVTFLHLTQASNSLTVTLPTAGAQAAQLKIFICTVNASGSSTVAGQTINAAGDMLICIFDGTSWQVGTAIA